MLKEVYKDYKLEYSNYILIIKSGNFYLSLNEDAIVMHNIFNYQIKNLTSFIRVGFPINSLSKITTKLDSLEINYLIIDKEIVAKKKNKKNNYHNYCSNNFNNNYQVYINRINKIDEILKSYLNDNNISKILEEVEKVICQIN